MAAHWRDARANDLESAHALRREFCAQTGQHWDEATDRAVLATLLDRPEWGRAWVLDDGGGLGGYAVVGYGFSLEFRGRDAFVDELYVAPAWRGKGYGAAALARLSAACEGAGVRALHLEVDFANDAALELYRRMGFADHGRRLMTRWIGSR